ncbi:MAG: class I SAM-dependent methyltransferase [Candidatus Saccharibacteria bacterium]
MILSPEEQGGAKDEGPVLLDVGPSRKIMRQAGKDDTCIECISKERSSHGEAWRSVHGSYFSDPAVARPFVEAIVSSFSISEPSVIADIGGGDGFMLRELSARAKMHFSRLVNVDASQEQLEACHSDLRRVCCSVMELERMQLVDKGTLTLISRSVLHYFGRAGQPEFLNKMRALLRPGEAFVHQPACFATSELAECMNEVYPLMGVDKTYFTPEELESMHRRAGFEVLSSEWGPPLDLRSEDLAVRYHLNEEKIEQIIRIIKRHGLDRDGTVEVAPGRFRTPFTYLILTLKAV